jgi:hypothetical protein
VLAELVEEREDLLVLEVDMSTKVNGRAFRGVTSVPRLEVYRRGKRGWEGQGYKPAVILRKLIEEE